MLPPCCKRKHTSVKTYRVTLEFWVDDESFGSVAHRVRDMQVLDSDEVPFDGDGISRRVELDVMAEMRDPEGPLPDNVRKLC